MMTIILPLSLSLVPHFFPGRAFIVWRKWFCFERRNLCEQIRISFAAGSISFKRQRTGSGILEIPGTTNDDAS